MLYRRKLAAIAAAALMLFAAMPASAHDAACWTYLKCELGADSCQFRIFHPVGMPDNYALAAGASVRVGLLGPGDLYCAAIGGPAPSPTCQRAPVNMNCPGDVDVFSMTAPAWTSPLPESEPNVGGVAASALSANKP